MSHQMQHANRTKEQLINELDAMRQRVAELERVNQHLDAFTYTVVHDLKRQLSLILGFSSSFEEEHTTVTREEGRGNEFYFTLPGGA